MILGILLVALFASPAISSVLPKLSANHLRSQFACDAELKEAAEALENGVESERVELVNLQETRDLDSTTLSLRSETRQFSLKLQPSTALISKNAIVRIVNGDEERYEVIHPSLRDAFYHGFVDDQDRGSVALAKTSRGWTGLVETRENKYILHGIPDSQDKYLLVRMEPQDIFNGDHESRILIREEVFNMTGDESYSRSGDPEFQMEIGAHTDDELYSYVKNQYPGENTEQKIQETILIILNTVHTYYQKPSVGNRITIVVTALNIMQTNEAGLVKSQGAKTYLNNFCAWDAANKNKGGANYDVGLIFTGYNIYSEDDGTDSVVGMAPLSGTCQFLSKISCGISEGKGFNAGLIMAHEIGHNLGMRHDGQGNSCPNNQYIMGPMISIGVTEFSQCSKDYLNNYLQKLDDFGINCLRDNGDALMQHAVAGQLPGERVPKGEQCSLIYGEGFTEDPTMQNFCNSIGCRKEMNGGYSSGSANEPPLPGTPCGESGYICYDGECQQSNEVDKKINNYKATNSGSQGNPLSLDQLCSKYGKGYSTGVDYDWMVANHYNIDLSNLCTNLLCFNGASLLSLLEPSPPGTSCAAGKTCQNFTCK